MKSFFSGFVRNSLRQPNIINFLSCFQHKVLIWSLIVIFVINFYKISLLHLISFERILRAVLISLSFYQYPVISCFSLLNFIWVLVICRLQLISYSRILFCLVSSFFTLCATLCNLFHNLCDLLLSTSALAKLHWREVH